jgi:hypothetical protein
LARKWNASVITELFWRVRKSGAADVFRATLDGRCRCCGFAGPIATNKFLFKDMGWRSGALVAVLCGLRPFLRAGDPR